MSTGSEKPLWDPGRVLWNRLLRQHGSAPASLSKPELLYFAICLFEGETYINGVLGYFESHASDLYAECVTGLDAIGATQAKSILEEVKIFAFGDLEVPQDMEKRLEIVRATEIRVESDELDAKMKNLSRKLVFDPELSTRLEAFARANNFWPADPTTQAPDSN